MKGEAEFVDRLRSLADAPAARGLMDDAAVLEVGGEALVLTHDMLVEGTHYLPGTDMADVAWKLVATNLSDLAAKGAEPIGVLIGYMLGDGNERFTAGLAEVLARYDLPLLGGDTVSGEGTRSFGLTAIGRATHVPVPSRAGARVGDDVYLCGTVGDAMFGCQDLSASVRAGDLGSEDYPAAPTDPYFTRKFLRPEPLLAEGRTLAPLVTAMMDISDGLLLDTSRLAQASGVTVDIDFDAVPFSPEFRARLGGNQLDALSNGWPIRRAAMAWGDDYALLFTVPAGLKPPVPATLIGNVLAKEANSLLLSGKPIEGSEALGYTHK